MILGNPTAAAAVTNFNVRWDSVEEAHVPLEIERNMAQLNEDEIVRKTNCNVKCSTTPEEVECDTSAIRRKLKPS